MTVFVNGRPTGRLHHHLVIDPDSSEELVVEGVKRRASNTKSPGYREIKEHIAKVVLCSAS